MIKTMGLVVLAAIGKPLSSTGRYKACDSCYYWNKECNKEKRHCKSRFQAEGVVWHLGNYQ